MIDRARLPDLPVRSSLPAVAAALGESGHALLVAPPGAGKTTLAPLLLLDEPWLADRKIVMLEPRRLAARAAARRMAELIGDRVGGVVGYQTRDDRRIGAMTRIEVVTEGILTRRLQSDPALAHVGLLVFDEIHERNLPTDLGLALALDARSVLRPDLRILAMSATAQADRLAVVIGGEEGSSPVIISEGREHDVDVRWRPTPGRQRVDATTAAAVGRALAEETGDVLVFLPGIGEIMRTARLLEQTVPADVDVRALAGALSAAEQDAALSPSPRGRRRVVLSTDIAETSITVEGVRVVVDAGLARVPRFDVGTGMTRLTTVATSRASADQRAGRAGRTEPGVVYRLWSKVDHASRPAHLQPEIASVDLAGLALELAAWGSEADALPFVDQPPSRALRQGQDLLRLLGALDDDNRLTDPGRTMLGLPVHPRLAAMVAATAPTEDGWLACLLACLLDERDVLRGRPGDLPADLGLRVAVLAGETDHPATDPRARRRILERAGDLARRSGTTATATVDQDRVGAVLLHAYPDRLGRRRRSPGQFQLRSGSGVWVPEDDTLASESFIVAADLDGARRAARMRLGAGIDGSTVAAILGDQVEERRSVEWSNDRDDLVERVERRLASMVLDERVGPAPAGPETTAALVRHLQVSKLGALPWSGQAHTLRQRVAFLRHHLGEPWPDWSDRALLASLDDWLEPFLTGLTSARHLEQLDLTLVLRSQLPWEVGAELDTLAPSRITVPSGRSVAVDYDSDPPVVAVRVQEMFGTTDHPTVLAGRVRAVLHLLSPADRPLQITSDLAGFWAGSWSEVRKEMAGRYPKHSWPVDPATADPPRGGTHR